MLQVGGKLQTLTKYAGVGLAIVYFAGMFLDVMDVDTAQYALISREMAQSFNFLQVTERGNDYLDKPPLLFWFSALAYIIFGVSQFTYRVFPVISTILGVYSTYRLGKLYYGERAGILSGWFLASCQAYFLMNHDVRTDTMLTNCVIFALWQICEYRQNLKLAYIFGGFTGIAFAMLAKGPIGLMVPVLALGTDFILKREWKWFFRLEWLLGLAIVLLWLSPMMYGLYLQFDSQPNKVTNAVKGASGLYFYFWKQSFGRITGENSWKDDSDAFFFVHTFLWTFLPWAFFFLPALWTALRDLFKQKFYLQKTQEGLTLGGFILPFLVLSTSHYKLPHYINILLPLASIQAGRYAVLLLDKAENKNFFNILLGFQNFTIVAIWSILGLLVGYCFPPNNIWQFGAIFLVVLWLSLIIFKYIKAENHVEKLILPSLLSIIGVNFMLNVYVYPVIFPYQTGKTVALFAQSKNISPKDIWVFVHGEDGAIYPHTLDFYSRNTIAGEAKNWVEMQNIAKKITQNKKYLYIYADKKAMEQILESDFNKEVVGKFQRFPVTQLTPMFLDPKTRHFELRDIYLIKVW